MSTSLLTIDAGEGIVVFGGRSVTLSKRETALLSALSEHPGKALSSAELERSAWSDGIAGPRAVEVYVARLGECLNTLGHPGIVKVGAGGYRLLDPSVPET